MDNLKCISLWQPWASLLCLPHPSTSGRSVKGYETRGWSTKHTGLLLIHAGKHFTRQERSVSIEPLIQEQLKTRYQRIQDLPRGAIIGLVKLVKCHPVEAVREALDEYAWAMGNYTAGRYAWEVRHPMLLKEPYPYRGQQGLFNVPATILNRLALPSEYYDWLIS